MPAGRFGRFSARSTSMTRVVCGKTLCAALCPSLSDTRPNCYVFVFRFLTAASPLHLKSKGKTIPTTTTTTTTQPNKQTNKQTNKQQQHATPTQTSRPVVFVIPHTRFSVIPLFRFSSPEEDWVSISGHIGPNGLNPTAFTLQPMPPRPVPRPRPRHALVPRRLGSIVPHRSARF